VYLVAPPVDRINLDDTFARLDAIGAGIHAQRPADTAGNAVIEMKTTDARVQRRRGQPLVGDRRAGAYLRLGDHFRLAEALRRQPDDDARNAAIAHQQIGADADHGHRHILRQRLQKSGEIVLVGGLEQQFRRPAGAEPGNLIHRRVRRQPPRTSLTLSPSRSSSTSPSIAVMTPVRLPVPRAAHRPTG
jgi:hypothetical protein